MVFSFILYLYFPFSNLQPLTNKTIFRLALSSFSSLNQNDRNFFWIRQKKKAEWCSSQPFVFKIWVCTLRKDRRPVSDYFLLHLFFRRDFPRCMVLFFAGVNRVVEGFAQSYSET